MIVIDGAIGAAFLNMRIEHPRMTTAHRVYDGLRQMKILAPHKPQRCACLFAPTQSGKSITVESYIESRIVDEALSLGLFPPGTDRDEIARDQCLALHVTLDGKASTRSLATAILNKFGDPRASQGTAYSLLGRAYDYMKKKGTQILFLDEVQHLDHRQTERDDKPKRASIPESTAVTDTLKTMLIRGLVPIVFIGTEESENMIMGDPQLSGRCMSKIDFACLRSDVGEEREIFLDYLGMLGLKLKQHGIFAEESDLLAGDIPPNIHKVASGRLGMASNLVQEACMIAREHGAVRLLREHLSEAVGEWAIPAGIIDYNPFEQGVGAYERKAA